MLLPLLLQLLQLLVLLRRKRLTITALHPFRLVAWLTRGRATRRHRDRLPKSRWCTGSALLMFSRTKRRRGAEPYALIIVRRRSLPCAATHGVWLRS